jgi:hypothetical protein
MTPRTAFSVRGLVASERQNERHNVVQQIQVGEVRGGYRFIGGDAQDSRSWRDVSVQRHTPPWVHDYDLESKICSTGEPHCSVPELEPLEADHQYPFQAFGEKAPAEGEPRNISPLPFFNGDITVSKTTDKNGRTVWTNTTLPSHFLSPGPGRPQGKVDRWLEQRPDGVYSVTHGYGENSNAFQWFLNDKFGSYLFWAADGALRRNYRSPARGEVRPGERSANMRK